MATEESSVDGVRNIAGLLLIKSDSSRLRDKNTLLFHGKPMFLWNVEKCVDIFDKVYVSSDDDDILDWADSRGATAIKRPEELCGDTPNIPVYQHAIEFMGDVDAIVAVQANSPTVSRDVIEKIKMAMEIYSEAMTVHQNGRIYGSVWGLTKDRLKSYKTKQSYYDPQPEYVVYDLSIDIHNKADYELASKQHSRWENI